MSKTIDANLKGKICRISKECFRCQRFCYSCGDVRRFQNLKPKPANKELPRAFPPLVRAILVQAGNRNTSLQRLGTRDSARVEQVLRALRVARDSEFPAVFGADTSRSPNAINYRPSHGDRSGWGQMISQREVSASLRHEPKGSNLKGFALTRLAQR